MYVVCFVVALLGQVLQILLKVSALSKKAKLAGEKYGLPEYLRDDKWTQLSGTVFSIMVLFFADEIMHWKDWLLEYVKFGFSFVGFAGAELATKLYSKANDKVNDLLGNSTPK